MRIKKFVPHVAYLIVTTYLYHQRTHNPIAGRLDGEQATMFSQAPMTVLNCFLLVVTLGSAYKCAPWLSNEECLAEARTFSAGLPNPDKAVAVAPLDIAPAQTFEKRAAQYTCAPTVKAEDCAAEASAFSACLQRNGSTSTCFESPTLPTTNVTTNFTTGLDVDIPPAVPITAPALLPRAAQFTCAPTVARSDCLARASSFSACLARNITASDCFKTLNTVNFTTTAAATTIPAPPPVKAAPCTLTKPGSTDVIILDACPPRLPQPNHKPLPPPAAFTVPPADGISFLLPTPTEPRLRELETPKGAWTTCVQNNLMNCNDALCTSDTIYAPRCTDPSFPRKEGRDLCINGLPARCEGFHCVFIEEAQRRENMRQGKSGSEWDVKPAVPVPLLGPADEGVCKGWDGPRAIAAPARPGGLLPTKTCVGQGVGRPKENGLGKVDPGDDRVWQNGECYTAL